MTLSILELFIMFIRFLFLFFGALVTFFLGETLYRSLNSLFYANSFPCLEMISFIVALVAPVAFLCGVHYNKVFFKRARFYNVSIFVLSYLFGMAIAFIPLQESVVGSAFCLQQTTLVAQIAHSVSTGATTMLLAYLSFDTGVYYARLVLHKLRKHTPVKKKKRTTKKRG